MDAIEVYNWMAYYKTLDDEFRKKVSREIALEKSAEQSKEERAQAIVEMFKGLGRNATNQ